MSDESANVTLLLERAQQGELAATDELVPILYSELRSLAAVMLAGEAPGRTLQPTALVHEAFLRLVGSGEANWENKGHFFGAAARAMRRILVDQARRRASLKRGGDRKRVDTEQAEPAIEPPSDDVLALHEALEELEKVDPRRARIALLFSFGGLTLPEIAEALGTSLSTVEREWRFTKALLHARITERRQS